MSELEYSIRAANPDNDSELRSLVRLFREAHADTYPIPGVLDVQFWKQHLDTKFFSLLVYRNQELVGHLALQPNRLIPSNIQLLHPACAPSEQKSLYRIANVVWRFIEHLQQRQDWQCVYMNPFSEARQIHEIEQDVFGAHEVHFSLASYGRVLTEGTNTVFSRNVRQRADEQPRLGTVKMRIFSPRFGRGTQQNPPLAIYPPTDHYEMCQFLYAPLPLVRDFSRSVKKRGRQRLGKFGSLSSQESSGKNGITQQSANPVVPVARSRFRQHVVSPSLLEDLGKNTFRGAPSDIIYVDLTDSACPEFCKNLSKQGYMFLGIAPLLYGFDSVVYGRRSLGRIKIRQLYSDRARVLARYVNDQLSGGSSSKNVVFSGSSPIEPSLVL